MNRRTLLAAFLALPAIAALRLKATLAVPLVEARPVEIAGPYALDAFGELYRLCRLPGEPDASYRERMLDKVTRKSADIPPYVLNSPSVYGHRDDMA